MKPYYERGGVTLFNARAEEILPQLPDNSVDLIATDPPYMNVRMECAWDRQWKDAGAFLSWMGGLMQEWRRILKPNGSLYVFASPQMSARVEVLTGEYFNVLNNIRWEKPFDNSERRHVAQVVEKEIARSYFPTGERIVFAEQYGADEVADEEAGYSARCEGTRRGIFGEYLQAEIERAGVTRKAVAALFPSATGGLTGCVSNWLLGLNRPTPEQYGAMRALLNSNGGEYLARDYADLCQAYEEERQQFEGFRQEFEAVRRPFLVSSRAPCFDVWDFIVQNNRPGDHPCKKPLAMMEHIIRTSSRPGAVVLDCFAGSGTTLRAAKNLGRQCIGVEMDEHWCRRIVDRVAQETLFCEALESEVQVLAEA